MTAAEQLLNMARTKGFMVATAESCTGGMVSAALTDIPGSSDVVDRGFVTYTNEAKMEMLGVRPETLDAYGAVSEETARELAEGALKNSRADLAVSITGIAGPGGSDFKPEGRVCFGVAMADKGTETETVEFGAIGRSKVRANSVQHALKMLISALS